MTEGGSRVDGIDVSVTARPSADLMAAVKEGLAAFNRSTWGADDTTLLGVFAERDGILVGGATGFSQWGWLFIEYLWVVDELRGQGLGASLLERSEHEGRERRCGAVWLDTFSFQAPTFYERFGYRQFGRLDGYPPGGARHFLWKPLAQQG